MGRGGGLVFTGMPRRREVLGTGIIRWEKVINPDGSVTWQEAQPTTASVTSSKKEEKGTKAEKQKLERPSWFETKKEATITNTKRPAKEVEDVAAQKEPKIEEARPRRAFSFHQTEEKKAERAEKTTHVEEIRFSAPIRKDDEKKGGLVAGLATKFGSTKKAEDMPIPKKDIPLPVEIQPTSASTSTHHTFLHLPTEEKLNTPSPPLSPPTTEEKKIKPVADDYFSHSHWSIRDDSKQESDAELAQRLANTEKIFRQQEQKIQAALDRIRDLERQLASGFTATATGGEQQDDDDEEVQTETGTKTWDNESIAAGGRESGPHFRQLHGNSSKGPLPCFSGDEPHFHYRVLTVNSHKPQVINNNIREQQRHYLHHEDIVIDNSDSDSDDNRTPSPIAVTFNIPAPPKPAASRNPPSKRQHQLPTKTAANFLDPITKSPQSFVLQSLKHEPTPSSVKTTTRTSTKKHKPLPLLPTDARAIPIRPSLRSPLSPLSPSSSTPLLSTSPTFPPTPTTPTSPSPIEVSTPSPTTTTPTKPSFCIPSHPPNSANRPPSRPTYHRSVSNFKNKRKLRPLTPIPEEPCPLKRRPRVRMRRSMSRSMSLSMAGDCDAPSSNGRPGSGSGSGRTQCAGGEEELGGSSSRGWRLLERVRTN